LFASLPSDVHIIPVDANSLVSNIIDDPAGFELTNVTDGCLDLTTFTLCSNPDEHLFWDDQHPSRQGHRFIANLAFDALGIPEPRAIAGLITVGLMAMGTVWRKNN
jgi:phospholipase/lecithinase/hemolysin